MVSKTFFRRNPDVLQGKVTRHSAKRPAVRMHGRASEAPEVLLFFLRAICYNTDKCFMKENRLRLLARSYEGFAMNDDYSSERLDYQSSHRDQEKPRGEYTPRPKSQIILAWVLIGIVVFGILGMCYWEIFGKF